VGVVGSGKSSLFASILGETHIIKVCCNLFVTINIIWICIIIIILIIILIVITVINDNNNNN